MNKPIYYLAYNDSLDFLRECILDSYCWTLFILILASNKIKWQQNLSKELIFLKSTYLSIIYLLRHFPIYLFSPPLPVVVKETNCWQKDTKLSYFLGLSSDWVQKWIVQHLWKDLLGLNVFYMCIICMRCFLQKTQVATSYSLRKNPQRFYVNRNHSCLNFNLYFVLPDSWNICNNQGKNTVLECHDTLLTERLAHF